jgi:multisubunit Na+/H+ antiporter MnhE subunit
VSRVLELLVIPTIVYLMVLGSIDPLDLLAGLVLSTLLFALFRRFLFATRPTLLAGVGRVLLAFVPFSCAVARDLVSDTWAVALVVLHVRPLSHPGFVTVPIGDRSPTGVAVTALVATLSPGSVMVDVDWRRRVILFHMLDASDPDAIRSRYEEFYLRYQRAVFP